MINLRCLDCNVLSPCLFLRTIITTIKEIFARPWLHNRTIIQCIEKLVSWAVDKKDAQENGILGLNTHQREEIGLKARRLIDESRVHALKSILNDKYKVEIFWYVQKM